MIDEIKSDAELLEQYGPSVFISLPFDLTKLIYLDFPLTLHEHGDCNRTQALNGD